MDLSKYHGDIIKEIQNIIKIKTVLDTPVENGPFGIGNKQCLEYVLNLCAKLGFKTVNLDGYCGYAQIGEGEEIFGIVSHLDVVPEGEGWDFGPYSGEIVDNIMYGRGTWDDKGPAIISIYALKALMDSGFEFNKRVRLIFGCNEETGSLCMEHYLEKDEPITYGFTPDADFPVIYGEKTINNITLTGNSVDNGSLKLVKIEAGEAFNAVISKATFTIECSCPVCKKEFIEMFNNEAKKHPIKYEIKENDLLLTIVVIGKAAHGSLPMLGVNAASYGIYILSKTNLENSFINWYSKYIDREYNGKKLGCFATDQYGDIAVNVGIVTYNNHNYFVGINCRLPFNTDSNKVVSQISNTLVNENVEVTLKSDSKGFIYDKNSPLIKSMMDAYQQVTNDYESQGMVIGGGTYARHFENCVGFGPSLPYSPVENMHSANERINLKHISTLLEIYVLAIKNLHDNVTYK